ncbi:MAG: aspartate carbamoyltransferase, partial [Candidatus Thermoplasmatota archaeon]|nr:aspartate carbamoyltransferase [Candidatus Thermoplasmatota archaeon]
MKHVVSIEDLDNKRIMDILKRAKQLVPIAQGKKKSKTLDGKILATCFFEPSTRTRLSFESAMQRLGGTCIGFADPSATSHLKGETLSDTMKMVAGYSDVIVLRHPHEGAAKLASEASEVPVINGGDGAGQHPTQTLLDLFTIKEEIGKLEGLNVGMLGDLRYGRTVHSLSQALDYFKTKFFFISPKSLKMPEHVTDDLENDWSTHENLDNVLGKLDVLYVTRIQKERFPDIEDYKKVAGAYRINTELLQHAQSKMRIMHPLPRVDEISPDVDETKHAAYFRQAF